jgi:Ser/Thr protein kinase RdoA (MazF antagonist)
MADRQTGCVSDPIEEVLYGGNVATSVVRIGPTVRKPIAAATPAVEAVLQHLQTVGFDAAPRTLGRDGLGQHVLEYIPGTVADALPPLSDAELDRLGRLVRSLHDALRDFVPPADAQWQVAIPPDREELICHNDLAPWNLIRDGDRWVFIDWDGAGPGSRLWDLAYAAQTFIPLWDGGKPDNCGRRLRRLADAYGLDQDYRHRWLQLITAHTRGMFTLLRESAVSGIQPWADLDQRGHGAVWLAAAQFTADHAQQWMDALTE